MGLRFKILSGPLQGKTYPVSSGAVVGRAAVEIQINDPKISGRHAKIELATSGELFLIDLGSRSGIRLKNKKHMKLQLVPGLTFSLGRTLIAVLGDLDDLADLEDKTSPPTLPPAALQKNLEPLEWFEYLAQFSLHAREKVSNEPNKLLPFRKLLVLKLLSGIQIGTEWVLGYGPRDVGLGSLDLPLYEAAAPHIAFTVSPDPEPLGDNCAALYSTLHAKKVLLNGRAVSSEKLVAGDIISIGETKIKVCFKE